MQFISESPEQTERLGAALAKTLRGGEVIAFRGGLGAGKTAFVRGLARGLGIAERVTSPTYTLVNEYAEGRLPLFHFDLYRIGSDEELFELGWEDYLARGGVCAVEWSENAPETARGAITVTLERVSDEARRITVTGGNYANFSV